MHQPGVQQEAFGIKVVCSPLGTAVLSQRCCAERQQGRRATAGEGEHDPPPLL